MLFLTEIEELNLFLPQQVLYFYVEKAPFHHKFLLMLKRLEIQYPHLSFTAIDVEQFASQAKRFSLLSAPTIILFKKGKEKKRTSYFSTIALNDIFGDIYSMNPQIGDVK